MWGHTAEPRPWGPPGERGLRRRQRSRHTGPGEAPAAPPPWRPAFPPAPSPPAPLGGGARGTHRVRVGAEVLEGEGAEDEAREQGRGALALHALRNGGGGGSPQRQPAAGRAVLLQNQPFHFALNCSS